MSTFRNLGKGSFKITTKDKFNPATMEENCFVHVADYPPAAGNNTRITFGNGIKEAPADVLIERGGELNLLVQPLSGGIFLAQMPITAEVIKGDTGDAYKTATYNGFDIDSYLNDKYNNDAGVVDMLKKYFFDKFVEQNSILNALVLTIVALGGEDLLFYDQEIYHHESGAYVLPDSGLEINTGYDVRIRLDYGKYYAAGLYLDYVPTMTVDVPNGWGDYPFPNGTYTMTDLSCFAGQTLKLTFSYVDESFGLTGPVPLLLSIDEE